MIFRNSFIVLLSFAILSTSVAHAESSRERCLFVSNGQFTIDATNASIDITGHNEDSIVIIETKSTVNCLIPVKNITFHVNDLSNRATCTITENKSNLSYINTSYEIIVPRQTKILSATTSNGSIKITNVKNVNFCESMNGPLTLKNIQDTVSATTKNGSIAISNVDGKIHATTNNGSITISNIEGEIYATTKNGNITVINCPSFITAMTFNGTLEAFNCPHPTNHFYATQK